MRDVENNIKISVIGAGYVGLSISILLARYHHVIVNDIDNKKVDKINSKISPIRDNEIENFIQSPHLNLVACNYWSKKFLESNYFVIALPTNFDEEKNAFNTNEIEKAIKKLSSIINEPIIIIKSTVPIGFSSNMQKKYPSSKIIFCPEFLREGKALEDNFYPSRIIVGSNAFEGEAFGMILKKASKSTKVNLVYMSLDEAEAVKLFSNAYLAMRVSFFNELDSFCLNRDLDALNVIEGVSMDLRIGNYYNNPSFGYGGYCLPKDTKQLEQSFGNTPETLISAISRSNKLRKDFVISKILNKNPKRVGIFRLSMKTDADNFRESSIIDVIHGLNKNGVEIIIYEPTLKEDEWCSHKILNNLDNFKVLSDLIIANRFSIMLDDVKNKVFTRDIFLVD